MKRITILLLTIIISISTVLAKPLDLAIEKLFDGRYNKEKTVSTYINKNNGKYYRGMTIKKNPAIIEKINEAFKKDTPKASNFSEYTGNGSKYISLKFTNNGEKIEVGLQQENSGDAYVFIQGNEKAFK